MFLRQPHLEDQFSHVNITLADYAMASFFSKENSRYALFFYD